MESGIDAASGAGHCCQSTSKDVSLIQSMHSNHNYLKLRILPIH